MLEDGTVTIDRLCAEGMADAIPALAALLRDCVEAGANIGFVLPLPPTQAEQFWRETILPDVAAGRRILLVARQGDRIAGTVHLSLAQMPNQPHRADINKMMVHPTMRRRGIARALIHRIEIEARGANRHLLTLDTTTDDEAEPLYRGLGYQTVGVIPDYALVPGGTHCRPTTIMFKAL